MTTKNAAAVKQTLLGVFYACTATGLGGMTVALTRLIIHDTDPLSLTFVRYGIAALTLLAILYPTLKWRKFPPRDFFWLTILGVVMFAGFPYFMARALEDTTAARGALLFAMMPISTMALAAIFRIERMTTIKLVAVAIAVTGAAIAMSERMDDIAPHALRGDLLMFVAMVCASSYNVFSAPYLKRYGNLQVLVYTIGVGVAVLFGLALMFGKPFSGSLDFDLAGWGVVLLLAVPGGALMMVSWSRALQLISPTQTAITVGLNPLTAMFLGAWLLSEPLTARIWIGFLLIVVAIVLVNVKAAIKSDAPEQEAPGPAP